MALFRFRARNPFRVRSVHRDGETDAARLARLLALLDDLGREIARERNGLRDRHESVRPSRSRRWRTIRPLACRR